MECETPSHRVAHEALPSGGTLLDVGCGGGAASLPLAPPAALLVGLDQSSWSRWPAWACTGDARNEMLELVKRLRDRHGATVVFNTHDLALARHVADRIVVVVAGRIVEDGPADEVVFRPRHEATITLLDASRRARTALS